MRLRLTGWTLCAESFELPFPDDLTKPIADTAQVLSVLLVFSGIAFSLLHTEAVNYIERDPPNGNKAREAERLRVFSFAKKKYSILVLSNIAFAYVLTPHSYKIFQLSTFNPWNFDLVVSLFFCLWIALILMSGWSVSILVKLIRKGQTLT